MSKSLKETLKSITDQAQEWIDERLGRGECTVHLIFDDGGVRPSSTAERISDDRTISNLDHSSELGIDSDSPAPRTDPRKTLRTVSNALHISLTHPLPLRTSQIPLLLTHLRTRMRFHGGGGAGSDRLASGSATGGRGIKVGLEGGFRAYTNGARQGDTGILEGGGRSNEGEDDGGRASLDDLGRNGMGRQSRGFLALKVGVGHDEASISKGVLFSRQFADSS